MMRCKNMNFYIGRIYTPSTISSIGDFENQAHKCGQICGETSYCGIGNFCVNSSGPDYCDLFNTSSMNKSIVSSLAITFSNS